MINQMDADKSGEVERIEFLTTMLVEWNKCSEEDIEEINDLFDCLDRDGGKFLSRCGEALFDLSCHTR